MAQNNSKPIQQQTAAQRDAQFIAEHPVEGRLVQTGAALTGAGEALNTSIDETAALVKKTFAPGDQGHIRHPIDEIAEGAVKFKNGISALTEPGDMNLSKAPHPYDKAVESLEKAGPIEGARVSAAAVTGVIADMAGSGKFKTADKLVETIGNASRFAKSIDAVDDVAAKSFLNQAVKRTETQLVEAMNEYERTARSAKTFGEELGRHEEHGEALVRFEIASIKLDALKHGGDPSINNPVIADLTKNGVNSEHFYSKNTMDELKKFDPNKLENHEDIASRIAADATLKAHETRLDRLLNMEKDGQVLTSQQTAELAVGKQYGPLAAANAHELMKHGELSSVKQFYPDKPWDLHGNLMSENMNDYYKVRESMLQNMSVDDMRKLGATETRNMEELIKVKESNLTATLSVGVQTERRASREGLKGETQISREEYMIAMSGNGHRESDASVLKFSQTGTYEQYKIWEARRNHMQAEINAENGNYSALELKQDKEMLQYLQERQKVLESKQLDNNPEAMRNIFNKEHQASDEHGQLDSAVKRTTPGSDKVSFNDAINHLEHPAAQAIVLARIQERQLNVSQAQSAGHELA